MKKLYSTLIMAIFMAASTGGWAQSTDTTGTGSATTGTGSASTTPKSRLERELSKEEGAESPDEEAYHAAYFDAAQACKEMKRFSAEKRACLKDARAKAAKTARMTK